MSKSENAPRRDVTLESEPLIDTVILYQKPILIGAIIIAVGISGGWLWWRSVQIREERATSAFQTAEMAFSAGNSALAQTELERMVTRFSGTTAGTQSAMLLAQLLFDQSKPVEGIAQLESVLAKAPAALRPGVLALIAGGQEGAGKPIDAAAAYGRAAQATPFQAERDRYLMEQARCLAAGGDRAGAQSIYGAVVSREDSPVNAEARLRLGELTATP